MQPQRPYDGPAPHPHQPPGHGQPASGPPGPQPYPYGQPQYGPPQSAPAGALVAPLGAPARIAPGLRRGVVAVLSVLMLGAATWGAYEGVVTDSRKLGFLLFLLPAIALMVALLFLLQDRVLTVACDGRVLQGTGVLGPQGVDLADLRRVASAHTRQGAVLVLHDGAARLTVPVKKLGGPGAPLFDAVGRAVWEGQQRGSYVVPADTAALWGMPARHDAPALKPGIDGAAGLAVVPLLAGLALGLVLGFVI